MQKNNDIDYFKNIRLADGCETFYPKLQQRIVQLSKNEKEHTTFELCYVEIKGKSYLALCTLFEERLIRVLTITTDEAIILQETLKEIINNNSVILTSPITDE